MACKGDSLQALRGLEQNGIRLVVTINPHCCSEHLNGSLRKEKFLHLGGKRFITVIPKGKDGTDCSNYCPVSLLNQDYKGVFTPIVRLLWSRISAFT